MTGFFAYLQAFHPTPDSLAAWAGELSVMPFKKHLIAPKLYVIVYKKNTKKGAKCKS